MQKKYTVLIAPGYENSGPGHWQTLWEQENSNFIRVQQRDWLNPVCSEWVQALDRAIRNTAGPKILVGHSLGCTTITKWAETHQDQIVGALLVAPPDLELSAVAALAPDFSPDSIARLNFPSIVVASTHDIYCSLEKVKMMAEAWGSRIVTIERAGHINVETGYGPWPEGKELLKELLTA